jgi:hypothetical protein
VNNKFLGGRATPGIIRGLLVATAALAITGIASAQDKQDKKDEISFELLSNPSTLLATTPPAGNHLFLAGHGVGSQGYVCLPKDGGVSWTVNGARPEATLFATFFGEPARSSPTSSVMMTTPTRTLPTRWHSATRLGRVPSTAAKYEPVQAPRQPSPPARTRVARIPARLAACYCSQSGQNRDQLAVKYWPKPLLSNA